jgi:hypothetical protein
MAKNMKSSFTWGKLTSMRSNNAGRRILIGAACFLLMLLPAFADAIGVLGTSQAKCYTRSISNSRVYGTNGVKAPTRAIRCVVCDRVGAMRRRTACNSQAVFASTMRSSVERGPSADGHPRTALGDAISEALAELKRLKTIGVEIAWKGLPAGVGGPVDVGVGLKQEGQRKGMGREGATEKLMKEPYQAVPVRRRSVQIRVSARCLQGVGGSHVSNVSNETGTKRARRFMEFKY